MSGKKARAKRQAPAPPPVAAKRGSRRAGISRTAGTSVAMVVVAVVGLYFLSSFHRQAGASAYPYAVGSPGPGRQAPNVDLPATTGGSFDLASYRGRKPVLLYFQEGLTCQPCWDQISAIQKDEAKFRALGIGPIVSITTDPLGEIAQKAHDEGLSIPVLSDRSGRVSDSYSARDYGMMGLARDGHTFVLVGRDGTILWRADYGGAPKYTMFVPVDVLLAQLRAHAGGKL
ncbi:MAG: peroxiredoxin family protein [Gaiellaceae bacterium]